MQNLKPALLSLLLGLLFTGQVSAHGLRTEQRRGPIDLICGNGAEDDAAKAETVAGAWADDVDGNMIRVTVQRLADRARVQPRKPPAVMAVALDDGMWWQTAHNKWVTVRNNKVPG